MYSVYTNKIPPHLQQWQPVKLVSSVLHQQLTHISIFKSFFLDRKIFNVIFRFAQVTSDVSQLLGEDKVDAILCVAGGWAGGSCSSKGQR